MKSAVVILIIIISGFSSIAQNNLDLDLTTAYDSTEEGKQKLARKLERKKKRDLRRARNRDTTAILNDSVRFNNSLVFNFVDNPAYTGQEAKNQINGEFVYSPYYRQQTLAYDLRYNSVFKKRRARLNGRKTKGLGIYNQTEQQFAFKQSRTGFSFARHYKIKNKVVVSIGGSWEYIQCKLRFNNLNFGDQIDSRNGYLYATQEQSMNNASSNFNMNYGLSFRTHKLYIGLFARNVTTPNESVTQGSSPLPMLIGFNISRNFKLKPKLILKPEFCFIKQQSLKTTLIVSHLIYKEKCLSGIGIKSFNTMYGEFGYIYKHFRFLLNAQFHFSNSIYEHGNISNAKLNIRYQF